MSVTIYKEAYLSYTIAPKISRQHPYLTYDNVLFFSRYFTVALNELFLAEITDDSTTYGTINWESGPYIPPNTDLTSQPCHIQGVLHLMPPEYANAVQLKFQTNSPTGWQFDIGDSSCHDGFGS